VNRQRIGVDCLLLGPALLVVLMTGCSTPAVGAPCLPEQIPATGFDDKEAYIESSSVQCQTRVCMVYKLAGDPRKGCRMTTPTAAAPACDPKTTANCPAVQATTQCASADEIEKRVYCTCRCKAPANTAFAECACPDDFSCVDVLDQGGPGVRGSYCVKKGTFTPM
jgi:hypothetical protein